MLSIAFLIKRSLQLDFQFLAMPGLSFGQRLGFIFKKYGHLVKNLALGFNEGAYASVFGRKYFYEDKFGISFLQSVYVDNWLLKKYVAEDSVIVDVGANIGQFNFFAKEFLKAASVFSFEPIASTFELLQMNEPDHAFPIGLSKSKATKKIYIPDTTLMASTVAPSEMAKVSAEKIRCETLDSIKELKAEKKIELLKIDTEGSELEVLQGARNSLKKVNFILIEASGNRESSGDIHEVFKFFDSLRPKFKLIDVGRPYTSDSGLFAIDLLFQKKK